ncbi:MAG: hypothetical protein ACK5XN_07925, partial [Bacteroidota bacterium]
MLVEVGAGDETGSDGFITPNVDTRASPVSGTTTLNRIRRVPLDGTAPARLVSAIVSATIVVGVATVV